MNQKFCAGCGRRVSDKTQENNEESIRNEDSVRTVEIIGNVQIPETTQAEDYILDENSEADAKDKELHKNRKPFIVISIILAVFCIVLGFLTFGKELYAKKSLPNEQKKTEAVPPILGATSETNATNTTNASNAQSVKIKVNQIDNKSFPLMKLYVSILDDKDESIDKLPLDYFSIREKIKESNNYILQKTQFATQLDTNESISINLVMDTSGSMDEDFKLENAKKAATSFISIVNDLDQLEILEFNDFVRTKTEFTNNKETLINSVSQLYPSGQTALYDAMYTALVQTSRKEGAKCVIVFTDGMSNKDTKNIQDVIDLAKKTGIPIYTIGIGNDIQIEVLTDIATQTGGYYVNTPNATELEEVYKSIFKIQKKQYVITYTSSNALQDNNWRNIELSISNDKYVGMSTKEYTPQIIKPSLATFDIAKVNEIIKTNVNGGNYSVVIKDLSNGEESRAGDYTQRMSASALINVPITLSIAEMVKKGEISLDTKIPFYYTVGGRGKFNKSNNGEMYTVDELLKVMMNYSDNNCTNTFISYIGMNKINSIISSYGLSQTELQRPLLVKDGNKDNWTTCEEIGKMLELLYSDSLPIGSAYMDKNFEILDVTKKDGILKYLPENIFALHHNGVTSDIYNETAFIGNGSKKYIITVMSCNGKQDKLAETTALISKYVYDEMLK